MTHEQRILAAVDDLVDRVDAGRSPTDALTDVVKAAGLTPHQADLVGRAYNTGESVRRIHAAGSPFERSADFPTADARQAVLQAYDPRPKTAHAVTFDYDHPPTWYVDPAVRAVQDQPPTIPKLATAPLARDPEARVRQARRDQGARDRAARQARHAAAVAKFAAEQAINRFRGDLGYAHAPAAEAVAADARALHGDAVGDFVTQLVADFPKRAAAPPAATTTPYVARAVALYDQLRHCSAYDDAADWLAKEAAAAWDRQLAAFAPPPPPPTGLVDCAVGRIAARQKTAAVDLNKSMHLGATVNLMAGLGDRFRESHVRAEDKMIEEIGSPIHEQKLRDIETQAMLQNFLMNDPVIRTHDPVEVARNFNELAQFAPRLANQPIMMGAMLRRSLQGPTDPFELKGFVETDKARTQSNDARYYVPTPDKQHRNALGVFRTIQPSSSSRPDSSGPSGKSK